MDRRSLLDYLADNDVPEPQAPARQAAGLLEQRLAELEAKLAAAARVDTTSAPDQSFSAQIEAILRRQREQVQFQQSRIAPPPVAAVPVAVQPRPRIEVPPPPLAVELPISQPQPQRSAEFTRFVEAVHLIGQAANRFMHEPPRPVMTVREPAPGPSEDTVRLTSSLKETIAAFQAMTGDLVAAAGAIRAAAQAPRVEVERDPPPSRRVSREDAEMFRLQDDLEDLRDRLGAMTRRRSRDNY